MSIHGHDPLCHERYRGPNPDCLTCLVIGFARADERFHADQRIVKALDAADEAGQNLDAWGVREIARAAVAGSAHTVRDDLAS